jgi:anti-sigma regulatory factor (Ser/Thr protein kinase)
MTSWSASLQIRSNPAELSRLASWLESWASKHGIADETAQQVDLCSAEAVSNVMNYNHDAGAIEVRIGQEGDNVVFEVEDGGIAFDPTQAEPPAPVTLDSDRVGGWGIRIVRKLSSEVRYQRVNGRNRLTLVFYPRSSAAA